MFKRSKGRLRRRAAIPDWNIGKRRTKHLLRALEPFARWLQIPASSLYADLRLNPRHMRANCVKLLVLSATTILLRKKSTARTLRRMIVVDGRLSSEFRTVSRAKAHVLRIEASLPIAYVARCRAEYLRILLQLVAGDVLGKRRSVQWLRTPHQNLSNREPLAAFKDGNDGHSVLAELQAEYRRRQRRNRGVILQSHFARGKSE